MEALFDNWTVQLRKGVLEFCVLSAMEFEADEHGTYGYNLARRLVKVKGLDVSEGSIYPLLSRMRKQGLLQSHLVESESGPARKYYRLTAAGLARAKAMKSYYDEMQEAVAEIRNS
ncbi:MAG: PadR family transcriptional regulator [Akkermansiaceae bacterium]|nr:PadR family transcriptional regulator [Akkermansiaceae bacterium]